MCSFEGINTFPYRGVVKWYHRGLQNLWWEFDSLHPCLKISIGFSGAFFVLKIDRCLKALYMVI